MRISRVRCWWEHGAISVRCVDHLVVHLKTVRQGRIVSPFSLNEEVSIPSKLHYFSFRSNSNDKMMHACSFPCICHLWSMHVYLFITSTWPFFASIIQNYLIIIPQIRTGYSSSQYFTCCHLGRHHINKWAHSIAQLCLHYSKNKKFAISNITIVIDLNRCRNTFCFRSPNLTTTFSQMILISVN